MMANPVNPSTPFVNTKGYLESTMQDVTIQGRFVANGGPLWFTLLDELLYLVASVIFLVGSYDFYPGVPYVKYVEGCALFIIGSAIFLGLSLYNGYEIAADAKLAGKPPDLLSLFEELLYLTGSALFLVGTFLFTPDLNDAAAEAAAFAEQVNGPGFALPEVSVNWFGKTFELVVSENVELPEPTDSSIEEGDVLFVAGSILFSVAAFVSALKAAGDSSMSDRAVLQRRVAVATASLYELGGVAFVVGTLGFIPASSLGITACPDGARKLTEAGANLFVGGSACYCVGAALTLVATGYLTYDGAAANAALMGAPGGYEVYDYVNGVGDEGAAAAGEADVQDTADGGGGEGGGEGGGGLLDEALSLLVPSLSSSTTASPPPPPPASGADGADAAFVSARGEEFFSSTPTYEQYVEGRRRQRRRPAEGSGGRVRQRQQQRRAQQQQQQQQQQRGGRAGRRRRRRAGR